MTNATLNELKYYNERNIAQEKFQTAFERFGGYEGFRNIIKAEQVIDDNLSGLANAFDIPYLQFMEMIWIADITRIKGIGWKFAWMLSDLGIYTARQLATYDSRQLQAKIHGLNGKYSKVKPIDRIQKWIDAAKGLENLADYGKL